MYWCMIVCIIHVQAKRLLCATIDEYLELYIVKAGTEISKLCQNIIKDNDVILVYALYVTNNRTCFQFTNYSSLFFCSIVSCVSDNIIKSFCL